MKALHKLALSLGVCGLVTFGPCAAAVSNGPNEAPGQIKIRVVNFKNCVEQSKIGKEEQASFEALKKQMETVLEEKEVALTEIETKLSDPDYLDSLSPEAETDLKRKYRALNQEINQKQSQYYQSLQQTNAKVVQKLNDVVMKLANEYAKKNKIDLVLSEENFYYDPSLDISPQVIALMDETYEKESKDQGPVETKGPAIRSN
jgi:outer membrane protein